MMNPSSIHLPRRPSPHAWALIATVLLGAALSPPCWALSLEQRRQAAEQTANSPTNACSPIRPFYWEIGNRWMELDSGKVKASADRLFYTGPQPQNSLPIASASKWLYAAYVLKTQPVLSAEDEQFLSFRSGYTRFTHCTRSQTVGECIQAQDGVPKGGSTTPEPGYGGDAYIDSFFYSGAHMQKHASLNPALRDLHASELAAEMNRVLDDKLGISYGQPQLAGGVSMSPAGYATFLRRVLSGKYMPGDSLRSPSTCANPNLPFIASATCLKQPTYSPLGSGAFEQSDLHYGLGHWIEDDVPGQAYVAYSSAGAFGFYPWVAVNASSGAREFYGLVVPKLPSLLDLRSGVDGSGVRPGQQSVACGRLIRDAWFSGRAQ